MRIPLSSTPVAGSELAPPGVGLDDESLVALTAWIKDDLRDRYARGERAEVAEYLARFPHLREVHDRVVSLVYEEFCLLEEWDGASDPERFCDRYERWRDSLISQLRYHRLLSEVVSPTPSTPRFPNPGDSFQGFQLRSILGRGGVARVYLAIDPKLGHREVALKVAPNRGHEASTQGRMDHDRIVPVLSVTPPDLDTGLLGLCMPYRPGSALDEVIRLIFPAIPTTPPTPSTPTTTPAATTSTSAPTPRPDRPRRALALWDALASKSLPEWELGPGASGWQGFPASGSYAEGVAWVVLTVARALEHAHGRGILHRDIKPANILLSLRDGPQLLDFNLAHDPHDAVEAEAALRGGTLPYMAPEQLVAFLDPSRWAAVGQPADLYALGLLLNELLTGRRPEAPDPNLPLPRAIGDLLDQRAAPPPSLREADPAIPHALGSIARRCLAFEPADRYPSAATLAEDLERFLELRALRHAPNPSRKELAVNWVRRHRRRLVLASALVGVAISVAMVLMALGKAQNYYIDRGYKLFGRGELDRSRKAYTAALRWGSRLYLPHAYLGDIASKQKRYKDAIGHLDKAIPIALQPAQDPGNKAIARLHLIRAIAAARLGHAIQEQKTPRGFSVASRLFDKAAADVAQFTRRTENIPLNAYETYSKEFTLALARVGQGDATSFFEYPEASITHYEDALALLDATLLMLRDKIEGESSPARVERLTACLENARSLREAASARWANEMKSLAPPRWERLPSADADEPIRNPEALAQSQE